MNSRLDGIQLLRGLAALMVVIGHNRGFWGEIDSGSFFDHLTSNAVFGVEIFFVISGFIITYSTREMNASSLRSTVSFLIKRFFRIYPLYFIILTIYILFFAYDFNHNHFVGYELSLQSIVKSYLFIPLDTNNTPPYYGWGTIIVSWTLGYEIYFYTVFGLALTISTKYRSIISSVLLIAIYLILSIYYGNSFSLDAHSFLISKTGFINNYGFIGNPIVFDFILGMIIAELYLKKRQLFLNNNTISYLAIPVLTMCFLLWLCGSFWGQGLTRSGLIAFFMVLSMIVIDTRFNVNYSKAMITLGTCSYSLYLIHIPIMKLISTYGDSISFIPHENSSIKFIFSVSLATSLSVVSYFLIEKKFISIGHKLASKL